MGVDLNTNNPANAGKMFVWNDRKGILMVHATSQDLDMIAYAIEALNQAPPEINIKSKFVEITQIDDRGLGFQWTLGNIKVGGTVGSGGTQPSLQSGVPTIGGDPIWILPRVPNAGTTIAPANTDGVITQGLRNAVGTSGTLPTIGTLTGILTDPQFRVAVNALEQRQGVDELNAPEVTTESGRQAQIQAVDVQTIVTGLQNGSQSGSTPAVSGVANGLGSPIVSPSLQNQYQSSALPFGPVLDVIPYLSADEYSIQMTLIPSVTEFVQYDDPGQFVPSSLVSGQTGNATLTAVLPLPHFRLRQVTTSVIVWDAQTVVLGGLLTDTVTKLKDKVPMLGDLPLFGRLFQSRVIQQDQEEPDDFRHADDHQPGWHSVSFRRRDALRATERHGPEDCGCPINVTMSGTNAREPARITEIFLCHYCSAPVKRWEDWVWSLPCPPPFLASPRIRPICTRRRAVNTPRPEICREIKSTRP